MKSFKSNIVCCYFAFLEVSHHTASWTEMCSVDVVIGRAAGSEDFFHGRDYL